MKRLPHRPRHILARCVAIVGVVVLGLALGSWIRDQSGRGGVPRPAAGPTMRPSTRPAVSPTPRPLSYSLTIPAQRDRSYEASPLTPETEPATRDGYREQTVSFVADGLKEYAQVLLPTTARPASGYPVILLVHGYVPPASYTTEESFYTGIGAQFAARGFAVVKPDLRGHGRSWGIPEGAYYSAGYVADVLDLAESLKGYQPVNASRLTLMGHSMGGHVALVAAVVRPQLFASVVLAAGSVGRLAGMYASWRANSDFGSPVTLGIRQRVITLFGEPSADSAFWNTVDSYTYLSQVTAPVLIAHDTDDNTVPYRFSPELASALAQAGGRPTLRSYTGGHSFLADPANGFIADAAAFITNPPPRLASPAPSPLTR